MTEETTEEKNGAYYQPSQRPSESDRPQTAPASSPAATAFSNALSGVRISPYGIGVAALVLAYGTLFSWLSILKYQSGHSYIWDLGIFDQVIWNTAQGHFFETSIYGHGSYLGEHLSLILSAFAPLYIVWSDVRLLLVVQSFYMAAGAVPIYLLARRNLRSGTGALLLAVSFLLFPNIAYVNLFDFHPETLLVVLFPWAIYFLHEGRDRPFLIAAGLSLLVKEDVALLVFALGLYAAFVKSRRCMGIGLAVLGLAWFAAAIYLVVPYFRGQGYGFLDRYSHLGSSATEIVFNLVLSPMSTMRLLFAPEKLHYLSQLLSPVAFLPLISPTLAGIGLPILVGNLLSNFPLQYSIFHQYSISLGPIFFASSVTAITRLSSWAKGFLCPECYARNLKNIHLALALIVFLFSLYAVGRDNPIGHFLSAGDLTPRPNRAALEEAARLIPPEASLATSNMLGARFTHRRQLFFFPVLPFSNQPARIDYFLVDVTDWDLGLPGGMRGQLEQAAPAAEYQTLLDKEGIVLLQRR